MKPHIRIGAGQGYYGDALRPAIDIIRHGKVDYLCFDALAELTLAIMQKDRQKNPELGYALDIGPMFKALLPEAARQGVKLITNAGGMNPRGAAVKVLEVARELGLQNLRIATVTGDNVLERIDELDREGVDFAHIERGAPLSEVRDRLLFANAYLGAGPIVEALRQGADIVITGRVADAAVFMAPMIHEFGWRTDDWSKLGQAALIGHIMECSGQATGGNFSGDWWNVDLADSAFPMVDVEPSGDAVFSKLPGKGGRVSFDTLKEQMLYEVHDPSRYITPDVVADFTTAVLQDLGGDRVALRGATGTARTDCYKVVMGYENGWLAQIVFGYAWPDALRKARRNEHIIRSQAEAAKLRIEEYRVDVLGHNAILGGPMEPLDQDPNEIWMRIAARMRDKKEAEKFLRLQLAMGLSGPPGRAGFGGKFPIRQLMGVWPSLIARDKVDERVRIDYVEV